MSPSPWRGQRQLIDCCNGCVPPKRYPGCGGHCPEYQKQKAKLKADKQREREYLKNHPTLSSYDFNKH